MLIDIKVPILSESVSEATLATWHKHIGEFINQDENLIDLETDKVVLEIVAPQDGVLKKIMKENGGTVKSDEVIAVIDTEATASVAVVEPFGQAIGNMSKSTVSNTKVAGVATKDEISTVSPVSYLSPAVRKMIADYNLDASEIPGTGKDGRITKADVLEYLTNNQQQQDNSDIPAPVTPPAIIPRPQTLKPVENTDRPEKRVPMSRLRARVAARLKEAQNSAAILTTFNEVNMKPIMDLRSKYKQTFSDKYETKLGFMSFFTHAAVNALKQFPIINASVDDEDIIYHGFYDIGIAVGSPRGLVVPIIRDVDRLSFAEIEMAITIYNEKAKTGKLSIEDLTGGTFSISNGGVFGSMLSTPILNPPQSAILGMHNIKDRAVVENGEIVIRPMMYLALSYDHRIIDGHDAVLFLVAIKQAIEDPARMLLNV